MNGLRAPTQEQAGALIAMGAVMFGAWVRLLIPMMAGFPVNDGGLFYAMLEALQANGLRIPAYVQYNGMSIPFAYPPLAFYAGALAERAFGLYHITLLQWMPGVVLIGTVPALYLLAREVLGSAWRAGLAAWLYAMTPRAITWQIMGGGLTRSFGQVFLILAAAFIYRTFRGQRRRDLVLAIAFSSLVVLSHPEAAVQTVGVGVLMWLWVGRSRKGSLDALTIGAGTLLVTSVWWLPVIVRYGTGTLLAAAQTGLHSFYFLLQPFLMNFIDEPMMTLIAAFGLIGIAYELSKRRALLPLWFFAPFAVEPRSAPTVAMIPLAMLGAIALAEVILPALAGVAGGKPEAGVNLLRSRPVNLFLLFIGLYMLGNASYYGSQMAGTVVSPRMREAFAWVRDNTPEGSRVLVLSGSPELFCDSTQEWFPALTGRVSVTTIQGKEWLLGGQFQQFAAESQAFQGCVASDTPLDCVERLSAEEDGGFGYDYVLVGARRPLFEACRTIDHTGEGARLITELEAAPGYSGLYDNGDSAVFKAP